MIMRRNRNERESTGSEEKWRKENSELSAIAGPGFLLIPGGGAIVLTNILLKFFPGLKRKKDSLQSFSLNQVRGEQKQVRKRELL